MEKFGILIVRDLVQTSQALADGLSIKFPCRREIPCPAYIKLDSNSSYYHWTDHRRTGAHMPASPAYEQTTTCVTAKDKARDCPLCDNPTCDGLSQTLSLATCLPRRVFKHSISILPATALCIFSKFGTQVRGNASVNSDCHIL